MAQAQAQAQAGDLVEQYLQAKRMGLNHAGRPASRNTIENYRTQLRKFEQAAGKPIAALTEADITAAFVQAREHELSNESINLMITAGRGFYRWATRTGQPTAATIEAFDGIQMKAGKPKEPRYITESQFKAILREIEQHDADKLAAALATPRGGNIPWTRDESRTLKKTLPLKLMFYAGARIQEACSLRIENIHPDGVIFVGKGDRERFVPLPSWLHQELVDFAAEFGEEPWVFVPSHKRAQNEGRHMQTTVLHIEFREAVKRAGLPGWITPHILRHSFAKQVLERTGRLDVVQDLLGHDDPKTTRIYARNTRADIVNQVKNLWT